jgi:hypothetical protein
MKLEIMKKLQEKFYTACKSGSIDIIKHLLESPTLNKDVDLADKSVAFKALKIACESCNEELIDYLLTKPEVLALNNNQSYSNFIEFNNISDVFSSVFASFCYKGDLKNIHLFYNREKYHKYLNLNYKNARCLRVAYENSEHEVIQFLIMEAKVLKSVFYSEEMEKPINRETIKFTKDLFIKQNLMSELSKTLTSREDIKVKKRLKI